MALLYGWLAVVTLVLRLFWAAILLLAVWGMGRTLTQRMRSVFPEAWGFGIGFAVWSLVWAGLGFAGWLQAGLVRLALLAALVATVPAWFLALEQWYERVHSDWQQEDLWGRTALIFFYGLLGFYLCQSLIFSPYLYAPAYLAKKMIATGALPGVFDVPQSLGLLYPALWMLVATVLKDAYVFNVLMVGFAIALSSMCFAFASRHLAPRHAYVLASVVLLMPGLAWLLRVEPWTWSYVFYVAGAFLFLFESSLHGDQLLKQACARSAAVWALFALIFMPENGFVSLLVCVSAHLILVWRANRKVIGQMLLLTGGILLLWCLPWLVRYLFLTQQISHPWVKIPWIPWLTSKIPFDQSPRVFLESWVLPLLERPWSFLHSAFGRECEWTGTLIWLGLIPGILLAGLLPLARLALTLLMVLGLGQYFLKIPTLILLPAYLIPMVVLFGLAVQRWILPRRYGGMLLVLAVVFHGSLWVNVFSQQWLVGPLAGCGRLALLKSIADYAHGETLQAATVPDLALAQYANAWLNDGQTILVLAGTPYFYREPVLQGNRDQQYVFNYEKFSSSTALLKALRLQGVRYVVQPTRQAPAAVTLTSPVARNFQDIMGQGKLLKENGGYVLYMLPDLLPEPPATGNVEMP